MNKETIVKLARYHKLRKELEILQKQKLSLEEALKLINMNKNRRIYRFLGDIAVEITYDEARKYIMEKLELIDIKIRRIERELNNLIKEFGQDKLVLHY